VVSANYTDNVPNNIRVEIYEMEDSPSAYGIFSISRISSEWTDQSGGLWAFEDGYVSFWKSDYFVTVSFSSGQNFDPVVLRNFGECISGKILEKSTYPRIIENFRDLSLDGKPVYLNGNISLSNFYYFDYRNVFQIREAAAGRGSGYNWIIVEYQDSSAALVVLNDAKQKVSENKRFSDLASTYRGFSCKDNKANSIMVRQTGQFITILVSTGQDVQLMAVMDAITSKIETGLN
jgi:hypothetical protein